MKTALVIFALALLILIVPDGSLIAFPWIMARWRRVEDGPEQIVGDVPHLDPRFFP